MGSGMENIRSFALLEEQIEREREREREQEERRTWKEHRKAREMFTSNPYKYAYTTYKECITTMRHKTIKYKQRLQKHQRLNSKSNTSHGKKYRRLV